MQPEWRWTGYSFRAMNTKIQTWLFSQTSSDVLVDVQRLFGSIEKRLSRFNPHSELSLLNQAPQTAFSASATLLDAMETALWAAQSTGGLYDPTILNQLKTAGYDRSFEQIERVALTAASPRPQPVTADYGISAGYSYQSVQLNRANRQIHKPVGVGLDLGGMGKGWTVDRAADRLQGLGPFLINAGGDIFAYQTPPSQKGWEVNLIHPLHPEQFIARLYLHHKALATSTVARRRWQKNGQIMHHLIDPRSGQPAQTDALSVSVVADRTVIAEVYAKVALILGVEQGIAWLQNLPGVEGLIYTADHQIVLTPGLVPLIDRLEPEGYANQVD